MLLSLETRQTVLNGAETLFNDTERKIDLFLEPEEILDPPRQSPEPRNRLQSHPLRCHRGQTTQTRQKGVQNPVFLLDSVFEPLERLVDLALEATSGAYCVGPSGGNGTAGALVSHRHR